MERQKEVPKIRSFDAKWLRKNWFYVLILITAFGHAFQYIIVDWPLVSLLIVGGFPVWLPTLLRNIESFEKTDKGWRLNLIEDRSGLSITELVRGVSENHVSLPSPMPDSSFTKLSPDARRVLKTLWSFQVSIFGEDDERRWGFRTAPAAPSYPSFWLGATELVRLKYALAEKYMVYLTNEGIEFCRQHRDSLEQEPLYYKKFSAAPGS
jgi:hypothetical protein